MSGKTQLKKTIEHKKLLLIRQCFYKLISLSFLLLTLNNGFAQSRSFVKKFQPLADSLSADYGIPSAVILGVSMIESGSGTSRNCKLLNNYFGIKGKNKLKKGIVSSYKQYSDATESFVHFCKVIKKKKFYKKLKGNKNYKLWLDAISKAGYSEIPVTWKQRVSEAIRKNKLNATR
jgi:flagellum-specific peptidoglycan hydrolase FlgJ